MTTTKTITWTTSTGAAIVAAFAIKRELDLQGRTKTDGRAELDITVTANGKKVNHYCLQDVTGHAWAVAKWGNVGLDADTKAAWDAAKAEVYVEIDSINAAHDAHEAELDAITTNSDEIARRMEMGN